MGTIPWPGYEPLLLARSLGYFDDEPIRLLDFPSATEVIRAYRNRAIDVAAVTADEALLLAESSAGQRIILVCDFSNGADVILAKPEFPALSALRGRRVGVESGALGAYLLARALTLSGIAAQDLTVETIPINEHESAFRAGRVDAVVTFEPVRSRLLAAGANQVFDSSRIPREIVDVLVTRAEMIDREADLLTALVRGWFRALDYLDKNPEDAARHMAGREEISPEAYLASLKLLEMPDRAAARLLLGPSTNNLVGALKRLEDTMREHRLLTRPLRGEQLLDPRFIPTEAW